MVSHWNLSDSKSLQVSWTLLRIRGGNSDIKKKTYIGISSTKWKIRYANHKFSFSHEHQKHQTALFKHFWSLKSKGLTPEIQWSILKKSNTPKCFDSRCNLRLEEKIQIIIYPDPEKLLNQRCEVNC